MLTEAYGADSVKSGFSLGYRLKKWSGSYGRRKEWTPGHVGPTEQAWTFVCTGRRFSIRFITKEVKLDRRPGEDMNFGFML
jgi:hypothetical protein